MTRLSEHGKRRKPPADLMIRLAWIVVGVVLVSGVVGGMHRGLRGRPNWGSLQRESTYVWEHRASAPGTAMFGYLPTAVFALWPFMVWPPQPLGLCLYVAFNLLCGVASLWIVYRWWLDPPKPDRLFVVVALLICANVQHVIQANQLTLWTLLLCVGGLTLVGRRYRFVGGLVLGLAGLIKIMPFALAGYLLLRRQGRSLAGMAVAVVLFDLLPSVAFLGWDGTVREHRAWVRRAGWHGNRVQIEDPLLIGVHRHTSNFSYASVLTRWLRGMPDANRMIALTGSPPSEVVADYRAKLRPDDVLLLAPMPPRDRAYDVSIESLADVPRFCLTRWSAGAVRWLWAGSLAVGLIGLGWATWRTSAHAAADADWPAVSALWLLAIFFVTPMMRHYYLALALPAVAVVWRTWVAELTDTDRQRGRGTKLAATALLAWLVGVLCLGWDTGRWYGLHLAICAVLAAATLQAWHRTLPRPQQDT